MKNLKKQQDNAIKVASIVEQLDTPEQQRAIDIVTSFALGVQMIKQVENQENKNEK